ncbi:hypothetical protein NMY22_g7310 [Coprinellus aureogranulatus]|nr:hypothetical protein NMY22_g7310 [Coprinellus aureogranulatus]
MSGEVVPDLVGLQVPDLCCVQYLQTLAPAENELTFNVLSLLALINIRESALQATRYTGPTCPLNVATNLPVLPSHIRTLLSHALDAAHLPSGENATCEICFWWPVSLVSGFVTDVRVSDDDAGDDEGKSDQRKSVWSSEPEMRSSGVDLRKVSYRAFASACASSSFAGFLPL